MPNDPTAAHIDPETLRGLVDAELKRIDETDPEALRRRSEALIRAAREPEYQLAAGQMLASIAAEAQKAIEVEAAAELYREAGPYDDRGNQIRPAGRAAWPSLATRRMLIVGPAWCRLRIAMAAAVHITRTANRGGLLTVPVGWWSDDRDMTVIQALSAVADIDTMTEYGTERIDRIAIAARARALQAIVIDMPADPASIMAGAGADKNMADFKYPKGSQFNRDRADRLNRPSVIVTASEVPAEVPSGWRLIVAEDVNPDGMPERASGQRWATVDVADIPAWPDGWPNMNPIEALALILDEQTKQAQLLARV